MCAWVSIVYIDWKKENIHTGFNDDEDDVDGDHNDNNGDTNN